MEPELIEWVDRHIGLPYVLNGRDPKVGLDCLGVALHFYRDYLGLAIFDDTEEVPKRWYDDPKYAEYMERLIHTHCQLLPEPEKFCLVLLAPENHFLANHIGIYLGEGAVLNTSEVTGVVVHKLAAFERTNTIKGFLKVRGQ